MAQGESGHRAAPETLFRHEDQSLGTPLPGVEVTDGLPFKMNRMFLDRIFARQRGHQLGLPVARDSGNTEDFAGVDRERDVNQIGAEGVIRL